MRGERERQSDDAATAYSPFLHRCRFLVASQLFVSPDYPFKGPTLQYEGHVVEFVVGKNQTDPREASIQSPWAPAMSLVDAVMRVEELLIEQQKKIEMEQKNLEAKRQEKLRMEEHKKEMEAQAKEGGQGEEGLDPDDPLYIPPFGTPSPGKKQPPGADNSPKARSPMRSPPKEGSLDANLAARSADPNTPSTKNPLAIDTDFADGADHVVDNYDEGDEEEEPPTPVVKLGRSEALPRRGSFRHSFSKGNDMGIDVDKLLAEEGVKNILDGTT